MNKLLFLLLGVVLGFIVAISAPTVRASWQRLKEAECIEAKYGGAVCIIWDELEQTNCYVYSRRDINGDSSLTGGISCIKKGQS